MLKGLLCLMMALLIVQSGSSTFCIKNVEVLTKYDPRYVLNRTNQIFSSDTPSKKSDLDCLIAELKATGIFADVRAELTPSKTRNFWNLLISTENVEHIQEVTISEVDLSGFHADVWTHFVSCLFTAFAHAASKPNLRCQGLGQDLFCSILWALPC